MDASQNPLVGADGELLEADKTVDTRKYEKYVANFQPQPLMQHINEWDEARITGWATAGCFVILVIGGLIGLAIVVLPMILSYWWN